MNVDYFSVARAGRLIALESLERRQPELPGFSTPAESFDLGNTVFVAQFSARVGPRVGQSAEPS